MSVLAYVHPLFNVDQCQAYMHTLRWQDRPLQCPRCQSQDVDPWGQYHYRPGCKRSWCHGCKRTFNDLTATPCTEARGRCRPRYSPPSCCACRARRDGLLGSEGSIPGRAIAGVGGCGIRPCPTKPIASWKAPWKRMTSTILRDTRASDARWEEGVGTPRAWAPQDTRARSGS